MNEESIKSVKISSLVRTNKFSVYAYYLLIVCKRVDCEFYSVNGFVFDYSIMFCVYCST